MVCKFKSRLYINPGNGYTVAEYSSMELDCIPSEAVISNYGTEVTFTAFGKELPCMDNVEVEMEGDWKRSEKYGLQFGVDWSRVLLPKSREGIIGYLSSELIKGIGPVMAREIVNRFEPIPSLLWRIIPMNSFLLRELLNRSWNLLLNPITRVRN